MYTEKYTKDLSREELQDMIQWFWHHGFMVNDCNLQDYLAHHYHPVSFPLTAEREQYKEMVDYIRGLMDANVIELGEALSVNNPQTICAKKHELDIIFNAYQKIIS